VTSATAQEVRGAVDTVLRAHQQSQEEALRTATATAAATAAGGATAKAATADAAEKGRLLRSCTLALCAIALEYCTSELRSIYASCFCVYSFTWSYQVACDLSLHCEACKT
jgi:hypothetical protein